MSEELILRIEMLGPLRLVRGGEVVTRFRTQKSAALLAYLALFPGPHPREQIVDMFWPDMDLPAGRNNLSTILSALRGLLEPPGVPRGSVLVTTHAQAGFNPSAVSTDVAEFEALLRQSEGLESAEHRAAVLARALDLYRGDFGAGNYEDWAVREAERLQARCTDALDRCAADRETLGQFGEAILATQRRLSLDPYAEGTHVALVRRHLLAGQPSAAREAARKLEQFFQEEFGTEPSPAIRQSIAELLASPLPTLSLSSPLPEREPIVEPSLLPLWLSRFLGRDREMAQLAGLLLPTKEDRAAPALCRLMTLMGPGGVGKTRLAVEFARRATGRSGNWTGFVPLADLREPEPIPILLCHVLGLLPSAAPLAQVTAFFAERERLCASSALLILDNLEHLPSFPVAEIIRALLRETKSLSILCTSRRRLGIQDERLMLLGPLPVPEETKENTLEELGRVPSVRLYIDRAQGVRPDFSLTLTNGPAVAALCRTLEGSPLALELAASWVRSLPPRRMWERLSQGLQMPEGRCADLPDRHRSLSAALDWSWRLLSPAQQTLLADVSVFRGGWTLAAAESVCETPNALEILADLQEASLVTVYESETGEVRYSLLETVRRYAAERLSERGDTPFVRDKQRDCFLTLAEEACPQLRGPEQKPWLDRLAAEHDNLRASLEWCLSSPASLTHGLRLAGALWQFWRIRGHVAEGRQWLSRVLAQAEGAAPSPPLGDALVAAGNLAFDQSDYTTARRRYEESLTLWRSLGDETGVAAMLNNLGVLATDQGDYAAARLLFAENLSLRRRQGNEAGIARSLYNLARVLGYQGDRTAARTLYEESLSMRRRLGDDAGVAAVLTNLGLMTADQGDVAAARAMHEESLALRQRLGDDGGAADSLNNLGTAMRQSGDYSSSRALYRESLVIRKRVGNMLGVVWSFDCLALLALVLKHPQRAARLLGATDSLRQAIGCPVPPTEQEKFAACLRDARAALGDTSFEAAWTAGRTMSAEQAIEYALMDDC